MAEAKTLFEDGLKQHNQRFPIISEFKFSCPHCQQHMQCDEQSSGREIQCPRCHHLIRIPPVPGKTAQYNPESGMTWATFLPSTKPPPSDKPPIIPPKNPESE